MASSEIRRGDFIYHDALFVDLGQGRRHTRASLAELKDLLLPRKTTELLKDQVAHWYQAQLIHYGLPPSRDKNTAKVRLTGAITSGSLVVHAHILRMEADMKKEFSSSLRKAKAAARSTDSPVTPRGKKRKADDIGETFTAFPLSNTTIIINNMNAPNASAINKRKKAASASPAKSAARVTNPRSKPAVQRGQISHPSPSPRRTRNSPQRTYNRTPRSYSGSNDVDMDDAPPPYESIDLTQGYSPYSPPTNSGVVQISGTYNIRAVDIGSRCELALRIDKSTDQLWGSFKIGTKTGVILMNRINGLATGETASFGWRAQDVGSDNLKFGRGCEGSMQFNGRGHVQGRFYGLMYGEDVEFQGDLVDMNDQPDARELQYRWDEFPRIAYGRS